MSVTPSGPLSLSVSSLKAMVEASSTFSGAGGVCHLDQAPKAAVRPFAILATGNHHGWQEVAGGQQNFLLPTGAILLRLEINADSGYLADTASDRMNAFYAAANFCGNVLAEVAALAGQDAYLSITEIVLVAPLQENPRDEWQSERFWSVTVAVLWGNIEPKG